MKTSSTRLAKSINTFSKQIAKLAASLNNEQRQNLIDILTREFTFVASIPAVASVPFTTTLNSSLVRGFSYNASTQNLTVNLTSNRSYIYHNVPASVVEEFAKAESAGKFFNQNIRNKYDWAEF